MSLSPGRHGKRNRATGQFVFSKSGDEGARGGTDLARINMHERWKMRGVEERGRGEMEQRYTESRGGERWREARKIEQVRR